MRTIKSLPTSFPGRLPKLLTIVSVLILFLPVVGFGAEGPAVPTLSLSMAAGEPEPSKISIYLEILFLLTILSVAPAIVLTATSFTRIIVVFSFLRQAMGTRKMPPNQILVALAIFMTVAIMMPVGKQINQTALQPYLHEKIEYKEAISKAQMPIRNFMFKHTRKKDLAVFFSITDMERPKNKTDVPTSLLLPAYLISELKTGFQIGFMIYVPFLILDMVVASILLSMGMMMLPPVMISLPFKILLFVLVDGWNLIIRSLVNSFA